SERRSLPHTRRWRGPCPPARFLRCHRSTGIGLAQVPPALVEQRRLPTTISLSKLNHAALVLAVYASQLSFPRPRGRTTTQDSLPAGGQPLPDGGHNPVRSQMKFQSLPSRYTTSS